MSKSKLQELKSEEKALHL